MSGFSAYKSKFKQDAGHALRSWREPELADWSLRLGAKAYRVHTAILGEGVRSSPVLKASFKRWGQESRESDIGAMIPEPCHPVFEVLLDFMYEDHEHYGGPELATAVPLFKMADMLEVRPLMEECIAFLERELGASSAPLVLRQALELELEGIAFEAVALMSRSFDSFRAVDFAPFDAATLGDVLSNACLCASAENVSHAVAEFARAGKLDEEAQFSLLAKHVSCVHPADALILLAKAIAFDCKGLCATCTSALTGNFSRLALADLRKIPDHSCVLGIFDSNELNATEDIVFDAITCYLQPSADGGGSRRFTPEEEQETWARCRFAFLSVEKWVAASDVESIPPRWFKLGAARSRLSGAPLKAFLAGRSEEEVRRFQPRVPWQSWMFEFGEAFDRNGVLYFLGTARGTRPYANPHESGDVVATMSSKSTGDESYICLHDPGQEVANETENIAGSWVAVDLGKQYRLRPTHYCLRTDSRKDEKLRHWTFQGSNDARKWVTLSTHAGDESLETTPMSTAAFTLDSLPPLDPWAAAALPPFHHRRESAFRHFRVVQTGKNSSSTDYLDIAGIELYGLLTESHWEQVEELRVYGVIDAGGPP